MPRNFITQRSLPPAISDASIDWYWICFDDCLDDVLGIATPSMLYNCSTFAVIELYIALLFALTERRLVFRPTNYQSLLVSNHAA